MSVFYFNFAPKCINMGLKGAMIDEYSHDSINFKVNLFSVQLPNILLLGCPSLSSSVRPSSFAEMTKKEGTDKCLIFDIWDSLCEKITTHQYNAVGKYVHILVESLPCHTLQTRSSTLHTPLPHSPSRLSKQSQGTY